MDFRYPFLAMANLIAGGFIALAVFAFSEGTAVTLGFAISIGVAVIGLAMAVSGRPAILGVLTAMLAGWTIVAANVFADPTAQWLVFASGLGHVSLSLIGLVQHEISTERVVHHLEVTGTREPAATS